MTRTEAARAVISAHLEKMGSCLFSDPVEHFEPGQLKLFEENSLWRALVAITPSGPLVLAEFGLKDSFK